MAKRILGEVGTTASHLRSGTSKKKSSLILFSSSLLLTLNDDASFIVHFWVLSFLVLLSSPLLLVLFSYFPSLSLSLTLDVPFFFPPIQPVQ